MKSVAFVTIGCKLNQFETEQMREAIQHCDYGTCAATEKADVYVVNTCTVTSKSDYRSRQAIRRAIRSNPEALVIVTGCYAQRAPHEVAQIGGVDVIIGNQEKVAITGYLSFQKQNWPFVEVTDPSQMAKVQAQRPLRRFGRYTRAFVKIQDGCDNRCAYCAVPLARGRSRSKSAEDVREEIDTLVQRGYKEIVLTGVHLGSYGKDLSPPTSLVELLKQITPAPGLRRVRLSSIEPTDFSDELIELMSEPSMKICPHVHIPLQSGDDRVLELMGRPYTGAFYRELIYRIASRVPLCGVGVDVMVGFPGENRQAFMNTYDLLQDLPVTYLHIFSFSIRPGTGAAAMEGQIKPVEKKRRSRMLRALGREKSLLFRSSLVGQTLDILTLGKKTRGLLSGLSGNYVKAYFEEDVPANTIVSGRITGIRATGVSATTRTGGFRVQQ